MGWTIIDSLKHKNAEIPDSLESIEQIPVAFFSINIDLSHLPVLATLLKVW